MKLFNILYDGNILHTDLTHEECVEVLQELSESFFSGEPIKPQLIQLEEI